MIQNFIKFKFKNKKLNTIIRNISQFLKTPSYFCLTLIIFLAIFGPFFVGDPLEISNGPRLSAPSLDFLFGTDQYGMDILSRVINGARIDLFTGFTASFLALLFITISEIAFKKSYENKYKNHTMSIGSSTAILV